MSYPLLLLILSVIVIVPTVFVVKGRSKQKLLANKNKGQAFIGHRQSATQANANQPTAEQLQIAQHINAYRNLPSLPISFRQLLTQIHSQYLTLAGVNLAPEQRFHVDKLTGTRLPEIIDTYLSLDKDYAEQHIIDSTNDLTSQDAVYGQLTSILEFLQQVQQEGQAQVASNILANRSYLQAVYGEYQPDGSSQTSAQGIKAPILKADALEQPASTEQLKDQGLSYLIDRDQAAPTQLALAQHDALLGDDLLIQLGQLTAATEQTFIYSQALLSQQPSLPAFQQILAQALPQLLRQSITAHLQASGAQSSNSENGSKEVDELPPLSEHQKALIKQKISRIQQLIEDCLNPLQKVAQQQYETGDSAASSLQTVQNTLKSKHSQAQYLLDNEFFNPV
ncbi:hypothetical protein [Psychrobacter lutiphocae]|uniref:hypothetical protein n=1 Tax=Psychrobacter lutiphocae TaxID=540500 RepID=UPI0005248F12|nr:hypothetical protein [Psychrobacter lutiphocae]